MRRLIGAFIRGMLYGIPAGAYAAREVQRAYRRGVLDGHREGVKYGRREALLSVAFPRETDR
jgi:hypothetical protein